MTIPDKKTSLALLRQMMVIRDFEETADKLSLIHI